MKPVLEFRLFRDIMTFFKAHGENYPKVDKAIERLYVMSRDQLSNYDDRMLFFSLVKLLDGNTAYDFRTISEMMSDLKNLKVYNSVNKTNVSKEMQDQVLSWYKWSDRMGLLEDLQDPFLDN